MSNLWIDYMISFLEFRETLRRWFQFLNLTITILRFG